MHKVALRFLIISFLALAAVIGVMLFQQGGYLQSRVFGQMEDVTPTAAPVVLDADGLDAYTKQEAYCFDVKEEYLQQCELSPENEQYDCDLGEAERLFQECLGETI